jgi:RimJ/RimL family protein N-acetyltransferase
MWNRFFKPKPVKPFITLASLERRNLNQLLKWRNDPNNWMYFRQSKLITQEQHQAWFEGLQNDPSVQMFTIFKDNDLAGACGFTSIDWVNRSAEVSFYIGDGYIDKEIAPVAFTYLVEHGFQWLGLHRLWVEIWAYDDRKRQLVTDAGFELEVTRRENHWNCGWRDAQIFGKLTNMKG